VVYITSASLIFVCLQAVEYFDLISATKLTGGEKRSMPVCKQHDRNEHTVRTAIKTIIWDMVLSNEKMRGYLEKAKEKKVGE